MRISFLVGVFAVLVAGSNGAVVKAPAARANLSVGYLNVGDKLLYRQYLYQPPIANTIQYQDVIYRGNATTRITALQATEVGGTQYGSAFILAGGLGATNVTVRIQSAKGYGYYYLLDIWGR